VPTKLRSYCNDFIAIYFVISSQDRSGMRCSKRLVKQGVVKDKRLGHTSQDYAEQTFVAPSTSG